MKHLYFNYTIKLSVLIALLSSCTAPQEPMQADNFDVTDSLINKLLVDTVQQANTRSELSFSARITADEERRADIFPMVSGTLQRVNVMLGDRVKKGQVLATMGSAEMAGFDKEAIAAAAELRNAKRELHQAEELYKSGLSSARELEQARNEHQVKKAELKRANAILKLNGGNSQGNYTIVSPINGFVIEKNVTSNMQLRPDNDKNLFTIADLSSVWAIINIYESEISRIKEDDEVSISILSYPESEFFGKIDKVYDQMDSESKVINARVTIANPDHRLKPGMMATVKISAKSGSNLPMVNNRGIIFDNNKNYVLVLGKDNKPDIREIEIGRKSTDRAYISKGLVAGDRIIASKQVFIYESLKK